MVTLTGLSPLQASFKLPPSLVFATRIPNPFARVSMRAQTRNDVKSPRVHTASGDEVVLESEEQRLKLDADARNTMAAVSELELGESSEGEHPGAWKWAIRKRVWDLLESENLAQLPRPVHHRIPNFIGAGAAAAKVRRIRDCSCQFSGEFGSYSRSFMKLWPKLSGDGCLLLCVLILVNNLHIILHRM